MELFLISVDSSGKVKLPQSFEQCQNKEHLWTSVKKGMQRIALNPLVSCLVNYIIGPILKQAHDQRNFLTSMNPAGVSWNHVGMENLVIDLFLVK